MRRGVISNFLRVKRYAPFASLAKRHCAFDNMVSINPAPGLYDITTVGPHSISKAPLFGRSNAERFTNIVSETPGPGSYQIPSHIHGLLRPKKRNGNVVNRLNVLEKSIDSVKEVVVSNDPRPHSGIRSEADFPVFKQHRDLGEVMGHSAAKGENHPEGFMARRTKQKIIWRRKYIPPSIPIGPTTFGYQETDSKLGFLCMNAEELSTSCPPILRFNNRWRTGP